MKIFHQKGKFFRQEITQGFGGEIILKNEIFWPRIYYGNLALMMNNFVVNKKLLKLLK
jgi:hypothetical protein